VHLRLRRPHIVIVDTQSPDNAHCNPGLLENLADHSHFGLLAWLDRPGRNLDTSDLQWQVIVREHQQPSVVYDIADSLPNETTLRTGTHATFSGTISATVSRSARRSSRSS